MTNEERRKALNTARAEAYKHAQAAEELYAMHSEDGPEVTLSLMWSGVADAMKDGDPVHDGPDGASAFQIPSTLTR